MIKKSLFVCLALTIIFFTPVHADDGRTENITIQKTGYIWIVGAANFELCRIITDDLTHVPQRPDISILCGQNSEDMLDSGAATLFYGGYYFYSENVTIELPEIILTAELNNNSLTITAVDPIPENYITRIEAVHSGGAVVCERDHRGTPTNGGGLICIIDNIQDGHLTYFAASSRGDLTRRHDLYLTPAGAVGNQTFIGWAPADRVPYCWGVFPDKYLPEWLKNKPGQYIKTSLPYYYLSGQALLSGHPGGSNCPNNGVIGGYATECGLMATKTDVLILQNIYDTQINEAAKLTGVSARLLKGLIAVESQYYPGALGINGERGLYQLTRDGADTLLRWNPKSYLFYCGEYLNHCVNFGYDSRQPWERELLISAVLETPNDINILGETLTANAYQVKALIENILRMPINETGFTYSELWKITTGNYHAGATVTAAALDQLDQLDQAPTWANYAAALDRVKPSALTYIKLVSMDRWKIIKEPQP